MTDDEMIAEFIRAKGVTKCPAAYAAPTSVEISDQDRAAHHARGIDPVGDAWRTKNAMPSSGAATQRNKRRGWSAYWAGKRGQT